MAGIQLSVILVKDDPGWKYGLIFSLAIQTVDSMRASVLRIGRKLSPLPSVSQSRSGRSVRLGNLPILEKYGQGRTFYGIYDPTRTTQDIVNPHFVIRAATFISDVVNTLTRTKVNEEQREVYPRCENRKRVASHVYRERNSYLATERKSQDRYKCYVCGFHYENLYGKLGVAFAEAHHLIPLNKVQGPRRTHIEDLVTVCANCHRMLHRMKGERGDVEKLKAIVRNNRKKRA